MFLLELAEFLQYLRICFLIGLAELDPDEFTALLIAGEVYPIISEDQLLFFGFRVLQLGP